MDQENDRCINSLSGKYLPWIKTVREYLLANAKEVTRGTMDDLFRLSSCQFNQLLTRGALYDEDAGLVMRFFREIAQSIESDSLSFPPLDNDVPIAIIQGEKYPHTNIKIPLNFLVGDYIITEKIVVASKPITFYEKIDAKDEVLIALNKLVSDSSNYVRDLGAKDIKENKREREKGEMGESVSYSIDILPRSTETAIHDYFSKRTILGSIEEIEKVGKATSRVPAIVKERKEQRIQDIVEQLTR